MYNIYFIYLCVYFPEVSNLLVVTKERAMTPQDSHLSFIRILKEDIQQVCLISLFTPSFFAKTLSFTLGEFLGHHLLLVLGSPPGLVFFLNDNQVVDFAGC